MIAKTVTISVDYTVDEATQIGVTGPEFDREYVKFIQETADDGTTLERTETMLPADVMNEYVAAQIKVPDEFVEVREAVQTKINALQAVL